MLISELKERKFKVHLYELLDLSKYDLPKEGSQRYNKFKPLLPKIKKLAPYFSDIIDVKLGEFEDTGFPKCIKFGKECCIVRDTYYVRETYYHGSSKGYRCVECFDVMLLSKDKYKKCYDFNSVIQFLKENTGIGEIILNNL